MGRPFLFMLALLITTAVFQPAAAQFPKMMLPKITEAKPQPTQSDNAKATSDAGSSSVRPNSQNAGASQPTASEPTINKPSIQINLRTHQQYYRNGVRDQDTWSWTPRIAYRVNGPISAGGQLSVDFTLPSGKAWIHFDCSTGLAKENYWWQTECGVNTNDVRDEDATIETGLAGFKINLKNELEGTSKNLFTGKFKVEKFVVNPANNPKFKNNFAYFVNYDWNLPMGYLMQDESMDIRAGNRPSPTEERFTFVTWFKGNPNDLNYGKFVAYLYYQGKLVGDSSGEGGKYGSSGCEEFNAASFESANGYCRRKFVLDAIVWDKQPQFHPDNFPMYKNPGEYEIKVLQNGKLARDAKFSVGSDGRLVDNGAGSRNSLGTGRIFMPVQVIGDQDGVANKDAWKTEAFFGNLLNGFAPPQ